MVSQLINGIFTKATKVLWLFAQDAHMGPHVVPSVIVIGLLLDGRLNG
jgi:hypothetical protein